MGRKDFFEEKKLKKMIYIFSITLIISIIAFLAIFVMYNKKLKEASRNSLLELGAMNDIVANDKIEETSISSDKTVANAVNNTTTNTVQNTTNNSNTVSKKQTRNVVNTEPVPAVVEENTTANITNTNNIDNTVVSEKTSENQEEKELHFIAPVSGEIIKDFAMDTLIYSDTLEEWTTHSGIDIKADKTTIVVAAEAGTVESIKNDPRYGLTVTIAHGNDFKTIYSNLLTAEFINEGESVEQGQTIGTVGESASFEISDETHLHFEMCLNGNSVNPTIYLKDV